jgi:hypothetical protein
VTAGEAWQPSFKVSGATASSCTLRIYTVPSTFPADPVTYLDYVVTPDGDGRCSYNLPAMVSGEYHQYVVQPELMGGLEDPNVRFGSSITAIPLPSPPVIDPPTGVPGGDTGIGVEPGAGQGLAVDLEVMPEAAPVAAATRSAVAALPPEPVCRDRAISGNLETGGAIPRLDATCGLSPGRYVATARMVDAAGVVVTSERSFTVLASPPTITSRSPIPGATRAPRNARPSVTFGGPVTGVSAATVRLLDVAAGVYVAATVVYDAATYGASLRPAALLRAGRTYRVYLTAGIESAGGAPLVATNWSFKVTTDVTKPTFTRSPVARATAVSPTANVTLRFSEAAVGVSGTSLRLRDQVTGLFVPATVTYNAAMRRATLNPVATLRGLRRYVVVIRSGITDRAGNPLSPTTWTFRTRR